MAKEPNDRDDRYLDAGYQPTNGELDDNNPPTGNDHSYKIVVIERLTAESFTMSINSHLKDGWEREGEMIVMKTGASRENIRYIQSMKRLS